MFKSRRHPQPNSAPAASPSALAGVRVAVSPDAVLPMEFAALKRSAETHLDRWSDGSVSEAAVIDVLASLIYEDPMGAQWTIGASTRQWYRRENSTDAWVRAEPPAA